MGDDLAVIGQIIGLESDGSLRLRNEHGEIHDSTIWGCAPASARMIYFAAEVKTCLIIYAIRNHPFTKKNRTIFTKSRAAEAKPAAPQRRNEQWPLPGHDSTTEIS